jgi:2-methylcitrate dehydratase PrpD
MNGDAEPRPETLTQRIADFAAGLRLDDVPADVVDKVKLHLIDTIGCGLAGIGSELAQRLIGATALEHAPGPCPVLGSTLAFGPAAAAFANAGAMNALDHDDGFEVDGKGMGHPGATLVAAALSGAAMMARSGRDLLTALVAAYEINGRVILSQQPSLERFRQIYGACQHQSIGAAVAYGRLAGLDAAAMANAIGFAATLAPVPSLRKYNWERRPLVSFKDFNAPTAEAGVRAVQFAAAGLVGARDVLDGETGFWRMMGSDRLDPALLAGELGETWRARHASFKAYPACRWIHTALESFETLRDSHGLDAGEIEEIVVHTSAGLARDFMDAEPANLVDAQFSLPYCLARLAHRDPAPLWFEPVVLASAGGDAVARRVTAVVDPEIDAAMSGETRRPAGQVHVVARGRRLEGPRLSHPLGTAERPMRREAVLAKFRLNATRALSPEAADDLTAALCDLEGLSDLQSLFALVRAPVRRR